MKIFQSQNFPKQRNKDIFENIYKNKTWQIDSADKSLSGSGSDVTSSAPYVEFIEEIIESYQIKSLVDLGHGDWNMWNNYKFANTKYIGIDVVPEVSAKCTEKYGSKNRQFRSGDAVSMRIPNAEMLITKDVLQHLPNQHVITLLSKLHSFEYVIICNDFITQFSLYDVKCQVKNFLKGFLKNNKVRNVAINPLAAFVNNVEIMSGSWRAIDLEIKPFLDSMSHFQLKKSFDYQVPNRKGIVKRVYFYQKIAK